MVKLEMYTEIIRNEFCNIGFGLGSAPVIWEWVATKATDEELMIVADLVSPVNDLMENRYAYKLDQIDSLIKHNPLNLEGMLSEEHIKIYPKMLESMKKLLELSISVA